MGATLKTDLYLPPSLTRLVPPVPVYQSMQAASKYFIHLIKTKIYHANISVLKMCICVLLKTCSPLIAASSGSSQL